MYVKLWELLRSVPLTGETPDLDMEINSISYDTRTLKPGALFAALPGARDDGARHIREALDRGAAAVLCRERPEEDGPWLVTPDPRRALALLSANWFGRPAEGLTLVGVTGTNGKTTTAFLIKDMLETVLRTRVGLIGTVQNMVGDEILPAGRWYGGRVECPAFTYSENKDAAGLTAKNIRLFPGHVEFEAVSREEIQRIHLPIPGGFTIYNALAAVSCGLCLGLTLAEIAASLRSAKGVRGRVEVVPVPTAYTVLIDYAHTPNALENVLLTARDFTAGRLICLFGCGGDRDRTKRPIMGGVVRELADVAVITSDNPRTEEPWAIIRDILAGMGGPGGEVHVEPDRKQAIRWALAQGRPGDVIVLAGKGHETVQEVQGVSLPLDEREVVAEYFEKRAQYRERAGNLPAGVV